MKTPTLFGFPLYKNLKRRIAKKHIKRIWQSNGWVDEDYRKWMDFASKINVGSIVSACKGLNEKITSITPVYYGVGKGYVLGNIEFNSDTNGCNARHCSVGPAKSYEECCKYRDFILSNPKSKDWDFDIQYSSEIMTIHEDGTYSINSELMFARINERRKKGE